MGLAWSWRLQVLIGPAKFGAKWQRAVTSVRTPVAMTLAVTVLGLSLAYGAFEATRLYGIERGIQQVVRNEQRCNRFAFIEIFSQDELHLDSDSDSVQFTDLSSGEEGGYRYHDEGLRLFLHDNGRLWSGPATGRYAKASWSYANMTAFTSRSPPNS